MALVPVWTMAVLAGTMIVKHYIADFVLQTDWMARGKEQEHGWFLPLAAHVSCHALATLGVALVVAPRLWWLALVDLAIHFCVDRAKSVVSRRTRWNPGQVQFWWLLGFDQMLHALTDLGLAACFLSL
ncbi:DUF3307 domain-containing protein [Methylobacterium oxalidis]|uniref:DUF3307 domain-containing protein n=1 Tax=Methylobacterium oxalidis TaxID=944322 RepID=A0A512J0U3_9HYPH|nr:DUF3307 domain-containing protein [Methylobacterium oxalidis]GEP03557.1 hypothetical protein MOX02_15950 [Methylobacterium oxalidis]GJE33081.1 hypothetical protein LDDCCGHA_3280 [Methylobacterium oxalidis]GLS66524.1 hypothetical protein GCM10007888_49070 [Methylobacterium oxalidis]